jgi:hypothetical protein
MINQHKADLKLLMSAIKTAINRTPSSLPRTMVIIQLAGRAGWWMMRMMMMIVDIISGWMDGWMNTHHIASHRPSIYPFSNMILPTTTTTTTTTTISSITTSTLL